MERYRITYKVNSEERITLIHAISIDEAIEIFNNVHGNFKIINVELF